MPRQQFPRKPPVFGGGWTLEAAESICADHQADDSPVLTVLAGPVVGGLIQVSRASRRGPAPTGARP